MRFAGGRRIASLIARLAITLLLLAGGARLHGVIFYATADPEHNTTAPAGSLANSGWQWVGYWGGFQGTPIDSHHFIAARHIGGAVGDPFILDGVTYTTTAVANDPGSDLAIWEVSDPFPTWAPLYRGSIEVGRSFVVFGRGLTRGGAITVGGAPKGWYWGAGDGRLRWGQNTFVQLVDGGSYWGQLLYATFDPGATAEEAHLAVGDSSGPLFLNDGTGWKLAGVAAAVDAYFNTTNSGNGFNAALFDARGLYYSSTPPTGWNLLVSASRVPTGFYATRVSAHLAWIDSIVPPASENEAPLLPPLALAVLAGLLGATGIRWLPKRPPL